MTDTIRNAQQVMLEILLEFDRICKEHDLTYWLDHGTLLGAVRHGGFIPWDDDLDVTMPREDYERFLEIAPSALPAKLFLQTQQSDPAYMNFFAKIRDRNSTFIDAWEAKRNIRYHQGIYIDIFPLNFIQNKRWTVLAYKSLVWLSKLLHNRYIKTKTVTSLWVKLLNRFHTPDGAFVVSGGENMHYVIHVDKAIIFPLGQIEFEGYRFPAPKDTDRYLKSIFGDDYLSLPPEEKRKVHSVSIKTEEPCPWEKEHHHV
jgi:lipopolysaccharide cholinephosphotransferase